MSKLAISFAFIVLCALLVFIDREHFRIVQELERCTQREPARDTVYISPVTDSIVWTCQEELDGQGYTYNLDTR
jgi:hypothetical protein